MKNRLFLYIWIVASILLAACTSKNNIKSTEWSELYRINVGGKYGFINENGEIIIEPQYDEAYFYFSDSVCFVRLGDRKGLVDITGNFVVEFNKDIIVQNYENGKAVCFDKDGKHGIVDLKGTYILPIIYKDISYDNNGFIVEDTTGKKGYLNSSGVFIVPCVYDYVGGFNEGLMVVASKNKYGYVDTLGNWIIDTLFDAARNFGEGVACVRKGENCFFIDCDGRFIDNMKYDEVLTDFSNNRASVRRKDSLFIIDKNGYTIQNVKVDAVGPFSEGFAVYKDNDKYGMIDTTGMIIIPAKYDDLSRYSKGIARGKLNDKYVIINTNNEVIIETTKDIIGGNGILIMAVDYPNGMERVTYYDYYGKQIWEDIPGVQFVWPQKPTKDDYIDYFNSKLYDLDPIEGVYYATLNQIIVNRQNDHAIYNGSLSEYVAVMRDDKPNEYQIIIISQDIYWIKKFIKIGDSNVYAVVNSEDNTTWAEDGKFVLENTGIFDFSLRQGSDNWNNWYVKCEFIKDYPSASVYEQVQQVEWSGSGFAIADGYLVTNYHVITGAKSISIKGVGGDMNEKYKGYVVALDKQHDLAIIRIVDNKFDGFGNIPYCIGKSVPEVGDNIFVLGYPMTNTMGKEIKLTDGIISAASGYKGDQSMYQISAAVQPGNSGGPLFDNEGNVIGIVCAKHADAENANYAIKVSYLYSLINNSGIGIKLSDNNKIKSKSLSKKVKLIKPYVYLIECRSH